MKRHIYKGTKKPVVIGIIAVVLIVVLLVLTLFADQFVGRAYFVSTDEITAGRAGFANRILLEDEGLIKVDLVAHPLKLTNAFSAKVHWDQDQLTFLRTETLDQYEDVAGIAIQIENNVINNQLLPNEADIRGAKVGGWDTDEPRTLATLIFRINPERQSEETFRLKLQDIQLGVDNNEYITEPDLGNFQDIAKSDFVERTTHLATARCGQTLSIENADYTMNQDIYCENSRGLTIDAPGIILDCKGHSIAGDLSEDSGIIINLRAENVEIKNCKVHGFGKYGIRSNAPSTTLTNNKIWGSYTGVRLINNEPTYSLNNNIICENPGIPGEDETDLQCSGDHPFEGSGNVLDTIGLAQNCQWNDQSGHYSACPEPANDDGDEYPNFADDCPNDQRYHMDTEENPCRNTPQYVGDVFGEDDGLNAMDISVLADHFDPDNPYQLEQNRLALANANCGDQHADGDATQEALSDLQAIANAIARGEVISCNQD